MVCRPPTSCKLLLFLLNWSSLLCIDVSTNKPIFTEHVHKALSCNLGNPTPVNVAVLIVCSLTVVKSTNNFRHLLVMQVLIPVGNGSEVIEIVAVADILRRAKVDVVVASVEKSVQIWTSQRTKIVADKLIGDAAESIYDLIILPVR